MENEKVVKEIKEEVDQEIKEEASKERQGKKLVCPRPACKHAWIYTGDAHYYTSCPRCHTSVSVRQKSMPDDSPAQKV